MPKKLVLILLIVLSLVPLPLALAEDTSDYQESLAENQRKQQEYLQEITRLRSEEVNLQNQISYFNSQIYLTTLQIDEAQTKINARRGELVLLGEDIGSLQERLGRLGEAVEFQDDVLNERVRARYKSSRISALEVIFGGESLGEMVARVKYLQVMEVQDRRLLNQMKMTRDNYQSQKTLLEEKKAEVEVVKAEIESQKSVLGAKKTNLDQQKQAKADLLSITQNDEKKFQEMLATLRAEEKEIRRTLGSLFALIAEGRVQGQDIARGEIVGLQGATGYVYPKPAQCLEMGLEPYCGSHLHFMVLENFSSCANPYSCHVNPDPYFDNPEYSNPMDFPGSWRDYVTQWYGETSFARSEKIDYHEDFHTGIDLAVVHGAPIKAIQGGKLYYWVDGAGGNYALVIHRDNLATAYWHLQ